MNEANNIKLKIVNGQLIALFLFIVTLLISILLTYNEKLNLEGKTPLFDNQKSLEIAIINRIIVVILGLYFVYTTIVNKELDDTNNIPILTSTLAFIASLIGLYDLLKSYIEVKENENSFEFRI